MAETANESGVLSPKSLIASIARACAHMYVEGERVGQPAMREQKSVIETIVATDYSGRALIELVQNAHDAHPSDRRDGRILVRLDSTAGDFGTLTVANGGRPFSERNVRAICSLALSDKTADEGIGNKGVGFKAVLQLTDSPAIYSSASAEGGRFDGYCFRFANHDDYDQIARDFDPSSPSLAEEMRQNVASLKLPVAIDDVPDGIGRLAADGYVSAVSMPLRSELALGAARSMIEELLDAEAPVHLFLERLDSVVIEIIDSEVASTPHVLSRELVSIDEIDGATVELVRLNGEHDYRIAKAQVPEALMRDAVDASRNDNRIGAAFDDWHGDTSVSVALRDDGVRTAGRVYTFLPMGTAAKSPLAAHIHAPFSVRLNRESMAEDVPLNRMLLERIADVTVAWLSAVDAGSTALADGTLIDLLSWDDSHAQLSVEASERRDVELAELCVVAVRSGVRARLLDAWLWNPTVETSRLTPQQIHEATGTEFVSDGFDDHRLAALERHADRLGLDMSPGDTEWLTWAAELAARAAKSVRGDAANQDWEFWAELWDELAALVPRPPDDVGEYRLVLTEGGEVVAPKDADAKRLLLFHPLTTETGLSEHELPAVLASKLSFVHPKIPRLDGLSRRPGRVWLNQTTGLVGDYTSDVLLRAVGDEMSADSVGVNAELLRLAFNVWKAARDRPDRALRASRLLLPTRSGWKIATKCWFSGRWGDGDDAETSSAYTAFVEAVAAKFDQLSDWPETLLAPPDDASWPDADHADLVAFAIAAGVKLGLQPEAAGSTPFQLRGDVVNRPVATSAPPVAVGVLGRALAMQWVRDAQAHAQGSIQWEGQIYTADQPLRRLPCQDLFDDFDDHLRMQFSELVLRALASWADDVFVMTFRRSSDGQSGKWPTPIASFLRHAAWIPQRLPGLGGERTHRPPSEAWWVRSGDSPNFLGAQPRSIRLIKPTTVTRRLGSLGVRFWDDPTSATERLDTVLQLVEERGARGRDLPELRNNYERAWDDVLARRTNLGDGRTVPLPERLLVQVRGEYQLLDLESVAAIYVTDSGGVHATELLSQTDLPVLALRNARLGDRLLDAYEATSPLARASSVEIEVLIDGVPPEDVDAVPLLDRWRWLGDLITTLVQSKTTDLRQLGPARLRQLEGDLRSIRVAEATEVLTFVDGEPMAADHSEHAVAVRRSGDLLVAVQHESKLGDRQVLSVAAPTLMASLRFAELSDSLQLALLRLPAGSLDWPSSGDLAAALNVSEHEVVAHTSQRAHLGTVLAESIRPIVAMCAIDLMDDLDAKSSSFVTEGDVRRWLEAVGERFPLGPGELINVSSMAPRETAEALGISFERMNGALRSIGRAPIHNRSGHAHQFERFALELMPALIERIRLAFLDRFDNGEALEGYVKVRDELAEVGPAPGWLDATWDLDRELVKRRFNDWFTEHGIGEPESENVLPALDQVRIANQRTVAGTLGQVGVTWAAWAARNGIPESELPAVPDAGHAHHRMLSAGILDFRQINAHRVIDFLAGDNSWPPDMPRSLTYSELEIDEEDVTAARERKREKERIAARKADSIAFGSREFLVDDDDRDILVDLVRSSFPERLVSRGLEVVSLRDLPVEQRSSGRRSGGGSAPGRRSSVSEGRRSNIGYVGELVVAEWLERVFGLPPAQTWKSAYSISATGREGSDSLGYDFRVTTEEATNLFEVKSSTGDDPEFEMGETEVRRAQQLDNNEVYTILFVSHVLDPTQTDIVQLPNPFVRGGLTGYQMRGQKLRLRFHAAVNS